jgi:hypothetical protein
MLLEDDDSSCSIRCDVIARHKAHRMACESHAVQTAFTLTTRVACSKLELAGVPTKHVTPGGSPRVQALRRQYNCTLPVEIAHRGDAEVDPVTRATLSREFAPVYWLDLNQQKYPGHHKQ